MRPWSGDCVNELVSQGFEVVEFPSQFSGSSDEFAVFQLVCSRYTTRPPEECESSQSQ